MLYYFTASNKDAQIHLEDTIKNAYPIKNLHHLLDNATLEVLKNNNSLDEVFMWGATPGKSNIARWGNLKPNDFILGYSQGKFLHIGQVFGKTHNRQLGSKVWGERKDGETWEYVYFIKNLKEVEIDKEDFSSFFGYKRNFTPQGFSNINTNSLNRVLDEFGTVENAIEFLSSKKLKITKEQFRSEISNKGERELENSISEMNDEQFASYINSLDDSASIEVKEGIKKVRKYNKKIINELKDKYNNKCQICGEGSIEKYGVPVVEGHHLEEFSLTQNNSPQNIMIVCPTHHRIIHKAKGTFNSQTKEIIYSNNYLEKLKLNKHL
ncbi:HNH endonuclease [Alkalihalobacillus clausii]|uniref:HNH endonuclease signature motif containing protein n=1 Tax=Shouchella clausii TaxID=79880 RepID=UPI00203F2046|nr:HNH endonuclease signature motif containing protein [Shouchella clausii]MCM3548565.1 HNH endonuclease [Shouchella clausii]